MQDQRVRGVAQLVEIHEFGGLGPTPGGPVGGRGDVGGRSDGHQVIPRGSDGDGLRAGGLDRLDGAHVEQADEPVGQLDGGGVDAVDVVAQYVLVEDLHPTAVIFNNR